MELLLNLKGFKGRIQQIDRNRAKYPVEIGYTLICNITRNVSEWPIKSPDPDNEGEYLAIHYADFSEPEKARANATELIKAYQEALINRSLEIEEKPVEEPIPGNLPRTRAKGPRVMDPDQAAAEAKQEREAQRKEAEAKYAEYIIDEGTESNRVAEEVKAQEPEEIPEEQSSGADPEEDQDLPADPEGEVRDQPENTDYLSTQWESLPADPEEEKTFPFLKKQIEEHNKRMEEKETREPVKPCSLKSGWTPVKVCSYCGGEVYYHTVEGPQNSFIHCHKCGEVYFFDDFFKDLEDSENRGQPEEIPPAPPLTSHHRQPCKLIELTQDRDAEPEPQIQKAEPENEIRITINPTGYSWKIISRAASLDEAVENAIRANEKLKESLIPKSE